MPSIVDQEVVAFRNIFRFDTVLLHYTFDKIGPHLFQLDHAKLPHYHALEASHVAFLSSDLEVRVDDPIELSVRP